MEAEDDTSRTAGSGSVRWPAHLSAERLAALRELITQADGEREQLAVLAPFTGGEIGRVPASTKEDVLMAIERARLAQDDWMQTPFSERRATFLRFHDRLLERRDELMDIVQLEGGKARRHAFEEVLDVVINSRYYAIHAEEYLQSRRRRGALPFLTNAWEHRHPVGVVGIIAPWNYPLTLAASDAIAALMAGNAVVLKPAVQTPFTALLTLELLREVGLPGDLFQIVTGRGRHVGAPLVAGTDFISFTGSTETGRKIARQAGEQLTGCSLELGGKNPMLILDDAPLERSVDGAVQGCFANAGQLCISFERLYVQRGIYDRFVEAFVERTRTLRMGASFDFDVEVGSLSSKEQFDKVQEHVQNAVDHGAEVLAGGEPLPEYGPFFYAPTILRGGTSTMKAACEETFGPVVVIHRFGEVDEAIRMTNDSAYGLNASIWTGRPRQAHAWAKRIECGTVNINEAYAAAWGSVDAPMGGMKASGLGRRHGREGIRKYTEAQTVAEQRMQPVLSFPETLDSDTYTRWMSRAIQMIRHLPGLR